MTWVMPRPLLVGDFLHIIHDVYTWCYHAVIFILTRSASVSAHQHWWHVVFASFFAHEQCWVARAWQWRLEALYKWLIFVTEAVDVVVFLVYGNYHISNWTLVIFLLYVLLISVGWCIQFDQHSIGGNRLATFIRKLDAWCFHIQYRTNQVER